MWKNGDNFVLKGRIREEARQALIILRFVPGIERDFKTGKLIRRRIFCLITGVQAVGTHMRTGGFVNRAF